jgi:hypothetical protein
MINATRIGASAFHGKACPPVLAVNAMGAVAGRLPGLTAVVMDSSVPLDRGGPEIHNAVDIPDRL